MRQQGRGLMTNPHIARLMKPLTLIRLGVNVKVVPFSLDLDQNVFSAFHVTQV